jgi:polyisoprenoid-binding protein YceI
VTDVRTTPDPSPPSRSRRPRGLWIALGVLVVALVGGAAVWYFVFRDTAPPEVSIDDAAKTLQGDDTPTSAAGSTAGDAALDGTWSVDSSIGEFDVDGGTFTSAFVGYRVNEELAGTGAKTAYGRTPDVTGSITIDGTTATAAEFTADLTTLESDDSRRDGQLRDQGIETAQFPTATFELTQPIDFGEVPADGATVTADAVGELTLHGVTRTVTIPIEARLVDDTIVVTSLFDIVFADYEITKPTSFAVLSIEDQGQMEVQLFFTRS